MKSIKFFSILFTILFFCVKGFAFDGGNVSLDYNEVFVKMVNKAKGDIFNLEIIPSPSFVKKPIKKWTVMVYMNAKNDLEINGLNDVNEMEMVGSSDEVNIVVELGRINGATAVDGDWSGSRRYLIKKDDDISHITSPILMEMPKTDMGDWKHLVDFAEWSMEKFPARHYMLVVWNHGSGWIKSKEIPAIKGISYDFVTGNHMSIPHFGMAMKEIGKIDILAMDACLMQMAEVAYQVKDYAHYIVASEENEPSAGYNYTSVFGLLVENPDMSALELGKVIIDAFVNHYKPLFKNVMHSAIKAAALDEFKVLLDDWTKNVMKVINPRSVIKARSSAQSFAYSENKDIYHFIKLLSKMSKNEEFIKKSDNLLKFMDDELIIHNRVSGSRYPNAYGLAICLPNRLYSNYGELKWALDSQWDEFTKWYVSQYKNR